MSSSQTPNPDPSSGKKPKRDLSPFLTSGYQLEAESPSGHDWLVAMTDNPDFERACEVFQRICRIWAKEVGIPQKILEDYRKPGLRTPKRILIRWKWLRKERGQSK